MLQKKLLMALFLVTTLVGCSGDEGDTVNVEISTAPVDGGDGGGDGGGEPTGDCAIVITATFVSYNSDCSVGTLSGTIDEDFTLTETVQWRLEGTVTVGNGNQTVADAAEVQAIKDAGVTLSIEPGTDIRGFDTGSLLVTRGSKLMAEGTASDPITFSSLDSNFDGLGEWGGLIIQGFAPQYGAGGTGACFGAGEVCNVEGEGGTDVSVYGGNDPADDSGVIKYVRIAEGGLVAGPNNEINGLTMQGVGHGTTVEFVQVHNNLDDGVEWFGGTVDARYLVLTGNDDDDIDFDEGSMINIQYAIVQKDKDADAPQGSNDPRGIEANSSDDEFVPETEAVIANVTIVGSDLVNNEASNKGQQPGMRLRGALTASIFNTSVQGFDTGCIRIDDADTDGDGTNDAFSTVSLTNVVGDCEDGFYDKRAADAEDNISSGTLTYSPTYAINEAVAVLDDAPTIEAVNNGSGFVFDNTRYIGAVDPSAGTGWWQDFAIPGSVLEPEPVAQADFVSCNGDQTVCTVEGTIDEDYTFVSGVEWRLSGEVLVGTGNVTVASDDDVTSIRNNGVTLTIRAGVDVKAFDDGSLLVTRGSKIMAIGSAASPITFSSLDDGFDGEGEWGGVIIQGFAPQFGAGGTGPCFGAGTVCNVVGEGGTVVGNYGGNDPADNSGVMRYVRIAEGGLVAGPNNEINGLTLQGVGHGTDLSFIHVHGNLDDGIEWFGGTVPVHHFVLTNNDDDDIDFDEGAMLNMQFGIVRKHPTKSSPTGSNDPRGIEANSSDDEFVPETDAAIANVVILGSDVNNDEGSSKGAQPGMRLRGAVMARIYNTAVRNFDTGCIRIDDADTDGDDAVDAFSVVALENVLTECEDGFYDKRAADIEINAGAANNTGVTMDEAAALTEAAATGVAAPGIVPSANGDGFVFEANTYIGAVEPGTAMEDAWWYPWIIPGALDNL